MSRSRKSRPLSMEEFEKLILCTGNSGGVVGSQPPAIYGPAVAGSSILPTASITAANSAVNGLLTPTECWNAFAATLNGSGYKFAAYALQHSLQAVPGDVNLNSPKGDLSSANAAAFLQELRNSVDLRAFVVKEVAKHGNATSFQVSLGANALVFTSGSNADLFGTLHNIDNVTISGTKDSRGNWRVSLSLHKIYNFEWSTYNYECTSRKGCFYGAAGAAVNNLAFVSQTLKIIRNYNITATLTVVGSGTSICSVT